MASIRQQAAKKQAAKKNKVVKQPRAPRAASGFVVTIHVNELVFTGKGKTAFEALSKVEVPRMIFKTKIIMCLKQGKREVVQPLFALQLKRFQNNKTSREIWAKRLETRLK